MLRGFGRVVWRAHHRAVRSLLVVEASSFNAMTISGLSLEEKSVGIMIIFTRRGKVCQRMFTSVLCEMDSLLLLFCHVSAVLLTSRLGDANSHVVCFQGSVDVDVERNATETLHSIKKAGHLQRIVSNIFFTRSSSKCRSNPYFPPNA